MTSALTKDSSAGTSMLRSQSPLRAVREAGSSTVVLSRWPFQSSSTVSSRPLAGMGTVGIALSELAAPSASGRPIQQRMVLAAPATKVSRIWPA